MTTTSKEYREIAHEAQLAVLRGDVVAESLDSIPMTVERVDINLSENKIEVSTVWFDENNKLHRGTFDYTKLITVDTPAWQI